MPSPLRVVFMGTAELACASLGALIRDPGYSVLGAVTQPDRPKGRDLRPTPSPVKALAMREGLPVWQPLKAREPDLARTLGELRPEVIVVAAYGQILPAHLLDLPPHGCVNVHASLLPRWRGAAPIQWALLEGDAETGVTIMRMDAGLDTGPILAQERTPVGLEDNAQTLHDRLAGMGAGLLLRTLPRFVAGEIQSVAQPDEGATYARKISKEDGCIDWSLPAASIRARLRAFTPWPGAFTFLALPTTGARLLKIWKMEVREDAVGTPGTVLAVEHDALLVSCGQGAVRITEVQLEGRRRMPVHGFLQGYPVRPGVVFSHP